MKQTRGVEKESTSLGRLWKGFKDFLYGFLLHGMVEEVAGRRREAERTFFLLIMGDLFGVPVFSGYYRLRLLPHFLPGIESWKRSVHAPKDLFNLTNE